MSSLAEHGLIWSFEELDGFAETGLDDSACCFCLSDAYLIISATLYLGRELIASLTLLLSNSYDLKLISSDTAASLTPALVSFKMKPSNLSLMVLNIKRRSSNDTDLYSSVRVMSTFSSISCFTLGFLLLHASWHIRYSTNYEMGMHCFLIMVLSVLLTAWTDADLVSLNYKPISYI